jgi:hypothetical protein
MLTKKQAAQRRKDKEREAAIVAKLSKELGRSEKGGRIKAKKPEKDLNVNYRHDESPYKSLTTTPTFEPEAIFFEEGYEERERIAQEEIAKKKKRVGVLVNKSGYQYISEETDLTTLGKK